MCAEEYKKASHRFGIKGFSFSVCFVLFVCVCFPAGMYLAHFQGKMSFLLLLRSNLAVFLVFVNMQIKSNPQGSLHQNNECSVVVRHKSSLSQMCIAV